MLRKVRYVMERNLAGTEYDGRINFIIPEDVRRAAGSTRLLFGRAAWDDMGQPYTITVTVRPGDRLN